MLEKEILDPRVVRTRQFILDAFGELMQEKVFKKITVQDITQRAGINRATFYAHFDDKNALLNYGVKHHFEETLDKWLTEDNSLSQENLCRLTMATFTFFEEFLGHCPPPTPDTPPAIPILQTQVQPILYKIIEDWLDLNEYLETNMRANMISWTIFGTALRWIEDKQDKSAETLAEELVSLIVSGLATRIQTPTP